MKNTLATECSLQLQRVTDDEVHNLMNIETIIPSKKVVKKNFLALGFAEFVKKYKIGCGCALLCSLGRQGYFRGVT